MQDCIRERITAYFLVIRTISAKPSGTIGPPPKNDNRAFRTRLEQLEWRRKCNVGIFKPRAVREHPAEAHGHRSWGQRLGPTWLFWIKSWDLQALRLWLRGTWLRSFKKCSFMTIILTSSNYHYYLSAVAVAAAAAAAVVVVVVLFSLVVVVVVVVVVGPLLSLLLTIIVSLYHVKPKRQETALLIAWAHLIL